MMETAPQRATHRRVLLAACGLVCAVAVVFGGVVGNDWVDFDDSHYVSKNPIFFPVNWHTLRAVWSLRFERMYVPVSYMLFAGECVASRAVAGGTATSDPPAAVFHGVSLALHAVVVLLVFAILQRIVSSVGAAATGALLFAVHPLQVESVAWVIEQRGLLAAAFSLGTVFFLLRLFERDAAPRLLSSRYLTATALLALALLSKPIAVVTPLIAGALLVHLHRAPPKTVAMVLLPWLILAAGVALLTRAMQSAVVSDRTYPLICRPLIAGDALAFYAGKIAAPVDLCVQYGRTPPAVLADPASPLRAFCVGVALLSAITLQRMALFKLPLALFLIPLTPVLGLKSFDFQLQSTVADRYVYLAMLGPAVALAMGMQYALEHGRWRGYAALVITVWMCFLGVLAARQVGVWHDTRTLASQACRVTPRAPMGWILMALHNLKAGDPAQAAACAERALELEPTNRFALFNAAEAAVQAGDTMALAAVRVKLLDRGVTNDALVYVMYTRGVVHLREGRTGLAQKCFAAAIEWDSEFLPALVNLGVLSSRRAEHGAAEELFRKAVAKDSEQSAAWVGLGNAIFHQGRAEEAIECFGKALDIDSADAGTLANRAWARVAVGDFRGAEADVAAIRALGVTPDRELVKAIAQPETSTEAADR